MARLGVLEISYSQVAVFNASMENPFNHWTQEHVRQGFSWRPGSVSFRTLREAGSIQLEVETSKSGRDYDSGADRIILVPFTVLDPGQLEIASIADSRVVELPPGEYALTFEHGIECSTRKMWARLVWTPAETSVAARVLRADSELSPGDELLMDASPAVPD